MREVEWIKELPGHDYCSKSAVSVMSVLFYDGGMSMRKTFTRIAVALAGLGLFAAAGGADAPTRLHDEVRSRILNEIGEEHDSGDVVRRALANDPEFGLLLEYFLETSQDALRRFHHSDDAVQETILKIWKGQPQIFLKSHDEVIKYFKTSTKHNAITAIKKANNRKELVGAGRSDSSEFSEVPGSWRQDPAEEAAQHDLFDELSSRLSPTDLEVLEAYASGASSQRDISKIVGISRYAAGQSTENIRHALQTLLPAEMGSL